MANGKRLQAAVLGLAAIGCAAYGIYHEAHMQAVAKDSARQASDGQELFAAMCQTCHGRGGDGSGGAPVLNSGATVRDYRDTGALAHFIRTRMPASDPGVLTRPEAWDLALFINKLNHRLPGNP